MNVVDKVMVWLGFERCDEPPTLGNEGKVLYKKRGADIVSDRAYQATSLQGEAAARAHIELTLFDKAVLWLFENIVSPFMKPSPAIPEAMVAVADASDTSIDNKSSDAISEQKRRAENQFDIQKNIIKSFLNNGLWPSNGNVFEDEVQSIASAHWADFEQLADKFIASEDDRLTYATAAYVLRKDKPVFANEKQMIAPSLPVTDTLVIEKNSVADEIVVPQISKGEELFRQFLQLYAAKDFEGLDSLGSPFFQPESLEFSRKIIDENNRIKKTFPVPPSSLEVDAAMYLRARKTALDGAAEEFLRRQEANLKAEQIQKEKKKLRAGEWEFGRFVEKFIDFRDKNLRFILLKNGDYLKNTKLLSFAAMMIDDVAATADQRQAAEYLSKWNRNADAAAEAANRQDGFSWPPEPAAPPPRRVAVPKSGPPPISPDQRAVESLLGADARQQRQLRGLMGLDAEIFRSGLEVLATIWPGPSSSASASENRLSGLPLISPDHLYGVYTDLEKADNAIKLINAIVNLNTGHDIDLSATVDMMRSCRDLITDRLLQYRRQIIDNRQIIPIEKLTADQMSRGQKIFDEFRRSFEAALSRGEPDALIMRDTYFLDECMSYAEHLQGIYATGVSLTDADQNSQIAIAYLMSQYNQFKSLTLT